MQLFPTDVSAFRRRLWVFRWESGGWWRLLLACMDVFLASLERTTPNFFCWCCSSKVDMCPACVPAVGVA